MVLIEVDPETDRYLEFAARIAKISKGEVIARLIGAEEGPASRTPSGPALGVPIHADYEGRRTHALFVPGPGRVEIVDGPLTGKTYRTPSEAAREVVHSSKPDVSPHRNGWTFWTISASSVPLQTIRYQAR
jgi:hypothetical protein